MNAVANTIAYLRKCQQARAAGYPVYLTNDPAWLLDMAINRRAGWVEDPHARGSVNAKVLPRHAAGDAQRHLSQLAYQINSRAVVRPSELGEWRRYLLARIPERFAQ